MLLIFSFVRIIYVRQNMSYYLMIYIEYFQIFILDLESYVILLQIGK